MKIVAQRLVYVFRLKIGIGSENRLFCLPCGK